MALDRVELARVALAKEATNSGETLCCASSSVMLSMDLSTSAGTPDRPVSRETSNTTKRERGEIRHGVDMAAGREGPSPSLRVTSGRT